jgi:amidase
VTGQGPQSTRNAHHHALSIEARTSRSTASRISNNDTFCVWADSAAACGLPATVAPIGHSPTGLPSGERDTNIGPYLEDRTDRLV